MYNSREYSSPSEAMIDPLGLSVVSGRMLEALQVSERDRLLIQHDPSPMGHSMALTMLRQARAMGVPAMLQPKSVHQELTMLAMSEDDLMQAQRQSGVLNPLTKELYIQAEIAKQRALVESATKVAIIRMNDPRKTPEVDSQTKTLWSEAMKEIIDIRVAKPWSLTYIPTVDEATRDGSDHQKYLRRYIDACSIPNERIEKAQKHLIDRYLDPAKAIQIIAGHPDDHFATNLTMKIEGQTFANSIAVKNIPGFEVFTGPKRWGANGVYGIPYQLDFNGLIVPNLRLEFKEGVVVSWYTTSPEGMAFLNNQFNIPGMREIGEVAIGTNSMLWRPSVNGMFVEKGAGGVHIALGHAYTYKEYLGRPVNVDNGVRSTEHVDISRSMVPLFGGGRIIVGDQIKKDENGITCIEGGTVIQENGFFLDPMLEILNPPEEVKDLYVPS